MHVTTTIEGTDQGPRRSAASRTRRRDDSRPIDEPLWVRRVSTITIVALVGYLCFNRSFAYVGIPAASVFIGEVLLVAAFAYRRLRQRVLDVLRQLVVPGPFHLLMWAITIFLVFGLFEAFYGRYLGYPIASIIKNLPFNYYVLYLPIGIAIGALDRDLLRRFSRVLAWTNAVYGLIFLALLQHLNLTLPWQPDVPLSGAGASAFAIMGLLCFGRGRKDWYLYALNFFLLFAGQVRGEWVGLLFALFAWSLVKRNIRVILSGLAAIVVVFGIMALAHIEIPAASNRGGTVSATGVLARSIAPFNKDLAKQYGGSDADVWAGTASWREHWWAAISASAQQDDVHWLFGNGYGFELRSLVTYVEPGVRTPHSVYYYALGYSGFVGVSLFALLTLGIASMLWRLAKTTGQAFGFVVIPLSLGLGLFGNWFETPFGAIPYYLLLGLSLAPLARRPAAPTAALGHGLTARGTRQRDRIGRVRL